MRREVEGKRSRALHLGARAWVGSLFKKGGLGMYWRTRENDSNSTQNSG